MYNRRTCFGSRLSAATSHRLKTVTCSPRGSIIRPSVSGSAALCKPTSSSQSLHCMAQPLRCLLARQRSWVQSLVVPTHLCCHQRVSRRRFISTEAGKSSSVAAAPVPERIEEKELHVEAAESYLAYAMSVIVGRALPDVRDGLKPVHRRILYAMNELGLNHSKPFRKCARVVGEVLGKYHPHGDSAVYEALVRMAQDFSMRQPLIAGHGNFGSVDDDPPAAMRYTECRLHAVTEDMLLSDLGANAVDFSPTFDASGDEPTVLPAKVPHLLINGASGIAVSLATRIPPHNMQEVVAGLRAAVENPDITSAELRQIIPAPDFPTGGEVLLGSGISEAYETGHGSVVMRGKAKIVVEGQEGRRGRGSQASSNGTGLSANAKHLIVISELPYQTNKAAFVEQVAELVESRVLEGVADVRDESDREGIRVVVEVKKTFPAEVVLNQLYKHTKLQSRFPCNMVALVDGAPKTLTLKEFLKHFLDFRCDVVRRRAEFLKARAEGRLHIVEGLLVAIQNMDDVVELIRAAKDSSSARGALETKFSLSNEQGEAVLALTLRRLTALEASKLQEELQQLKNTLQGLNRLLASQEEILQVVVREADEVVQKFGSPRRSTLVEDQGEVKDIDVVPNLESLLMFSRRGYIKRMQVDAFAAQRRGGKGKAGAKLKEDDLLEDMVRVMDHDDILLFTAQGQVFSIKAYQVPGTLSRNTIGTAIRQLVKVDPGDQVTCLLPVPKDFQEGQFVIMLTKQAQIKSLSSSHIGSLNANGKRVFNLAEGDQVCWVGSASAQCSMLLANNQGYVMHFKASSLRPRTRQAGGLAAMRLKEGQHVVSMCILPANLAQTDANVEEDEAELATAEISSSSSDSESNSDSESGLETTNQTFENGVAVKGSMGSGHVSAAGSGRQNVEEQVVAEMEQASQSTQLLLVTENGLGKRVPIGAFRITSRNKLGVVGIKLQEGDQLLSLHVVQPGDQVALGTAKGNVMRVNADGIRKTGRVAQGVKIINLEEGDKVQTVTVIPATASAVADQS